MKVITVSGGTAARGVCTCMCTTSSTYNTGRADGSAISGCGRHCYSGDYANNVANYNAAKQA